MADTRRTINELLTQLFQDGQTEGISAQDMRDLIVTMEESHGDFYVTTPAGTSITVAGTYVKAAGTTTFSADNEYTDANSSDNRIRYTGATTQHMYITGCGDITSLQNNRTLGFAIYFYDASAGSGSIQAKGKIRQKIGTGSDIAAFSVATDINMDTNDYVEFWLTDEDGTNTITVENFYLRAWGSTA